MTDTTLMTDGAQTTPAAPSAAPADAASATAATSAVDMNAGAPAADPGADGAPKAADAPKTDEAPALPEKYEFTMPEGVALDETAAAELDAIAREFKLDQVGAQKLADLGAKQAQKFAAAQADAIEQAAATWITEAQADKEFGGDKLDESLATARKALDAFGTPELRELLNGSKLGNHPEVIRFMVRAGRAISEDRMVTGGASPTSAPTAQRLYAASNMNP